MSFLGPPSALMNQEQSRSSAEDYTVVPQWIPFRTNMVYRVHEISKHMEKDEDGIEYDSGTSTGLSIEGSEIVIVRSYVEFEPEWFDLITRLYNKPVIAVGSLPIKDDDDEEEDWIQIKGWLDLQDENSLVYVALGTEATLSQTEVPELALGLEQCGLPFFWVLNRGSASEMLPRGFRDRVRDRGIVYTKWAPQVRILRHRAVGGFLTHCGWNSVTEALGFGRVLILFPVMNDQGLNARLLGERRVGVEIRRDERDGAFTSGEVAEAVRAAMVGEEGRGVRENVREMKGLFGDWSRNECYVEDLVSQMVQIRCKCLKSELE